MKCRIFKDLTEDSCYWVKFEYVYYPINTYNSAKGMAKNLEEGDAEGYSGGNYMGGHTQRCMSNLKEIL